MVKQWDLIDTCYTANGSVVFPPFHPTTLRVQKIDAEMMQKLYKGRLFINRSL